MDTNTNTETTAARIARLKLEELSEARVATLEHATAADDETFLAIAKSIRVRRNSETIFLPPHRFEGLSRGRGWARKGRGKNVEWADRTEKGYLCGPGLWSVGGSDGFSRKDANEWTVKTVTVGYEKWTIAK